MKYAVILPDGAADEPLDELDGQTPIEAARIPNIDWIATNGRQGTMVTIPEGLPADSAVATLSVVGYDPRTCYPGRAPIEAAARRIRLGPHDLAFRCNLVTIVDGAMEDFSAGHIGQEEAERIIADLNEHLGDERISFYPGISYRHLMVLRNAQKIRVACTPPHDIPNQPVRGYLPAGRGSKLIRSLMDKSVEILAEHEVNEVRRDLGESPATSIWLWGQGKMPQLKPFRDKYGVRAASITGVDVIRGIAALVGWCQISVDGATGYLDTNFAGKGAAAVSALDEFDMVIVHVEAPDEAGHNGNAAAKIRALQRIDEFIVGPVLDKLRSFGDRWRILVAPDHPTPVSSRIHTTAPPPFCMAGQGVTGVLRRPFSESDADQSDLHINPGYELMEYFLKRL